jgi:exopolyphosphatase/pppGpp-phosphohydrolase
MSKQSDSSSDEPTEFSEQVDDPKQVEAHKEQFYKDLDAVLNEKDGRQSWNKFEYDTLIHEISQAINNKNRTDRQRYLLRTYELLTIGETTKIIKSTKIKKNKKSENSQKEKKRVIYFICIEEVFDVLHLLHKQCGHKGRDIMNKSVKKQYANITLIMINTYLASCQQCVLNKKRNKTTGITINV